ncbi:hypothetical protein [Sabulicella rubraurantiaca]|uniref:hypothetical protein n=1 Tax=Sabulicella rubraurantiaca TaxID=2811429 RepID=UPI001A958281|nr:hypothetical protein [Sabulicella rubraurantiaca]
MGAGGAALGELLSALPLPAPARDELRRRLLAPGRHYHGAEHVGLLWRRHRLLSRGTPFRAPRLERLIALAIAFHDAVYEPGRHDNEASSAALFRRRARGHLPRGEVRWVEGTILATADHLGTPPTRRTAPQERARLWVLDLDLTPLGERPAVFARNTRALRCEQGTAWEAGCASFLARAAAARPLYRTPRIEARFGVRARANLAHRLS